MKHQEAIKIGDKVFTKFNGKYEVKEIDGEWVRCQDVEDKKRVREWHISELRLA